MHSCFQRYNPVSPQHLSVHLNGISVTSTENATGNLTICYTSSITINCSCHLPCRFQLCGYRTIPRDISNATSCKRFIINRSFICFTYTTENILVTLRFNGTKHCSLFRDLLHTLVYSDEYNLVTPENSSPWKSEIALRYRQISKLRKLPKFEVTLRLTVGRSVSMSWYRAPLWDLRPDITSCRNVVV
jgi:hypothetical protein